MPGPRIRHQKITAPFTPEQVTALNDYQQHGAFHPFTCGRGADGRHVGGVRLIADPAGWRCPFAGCPYTQDWAWDFMTQPAEVSRQVAAAIDGLAPDEH